MGDGIFFSAKDVNKSFSGNQVLFDAGISVNTGEIHGLLGENGAGKSTLLKIFANVVPADSGQILIDGKPVCCAHLIDTFLSGIGIVYQESTLLPNLSVAENIFIGRLSDFYSKGVLQWNEMISEADRIFKEKIGYSLDTSKAAADYNFAERTLIEIARALAYNPKLLLLDEITTTLDFDRIKIIMNLLKNFSNEGGSVIYISHRLNEVFDICDRVTVLRDGHVVGTSSIADVDEDSLAEMMVGRNLEELGARNKIKDVALHEKKELILEVENIAIGSCVKGVSFSAYKGEVLGLAGLGGCGTEEIVKAIYGAVGIASGDIRYNSESIVGKSINSIMNLGISYVPKERLSEGLVPIFSINENISIGLLDNFSRFKGLYLDVRKLTDLAKQCIKKYHIKAKDQHTVLNSLSGGNQQKVLIARSISSDANLFLLNNPTRGVDLGVKSEVYSLIDSLRLDGKTIIITSEELPELIRLSDRVICVRAGLITNEFKNNEELSEEKIIKYML